VGIRLSLLALAVLSPAVLVACGDHVVTREDAAPCVRALEAWWPDANSLDLGPADEQDRTAARVRTAAAAIRANCDARTLPVSLTDAGFTVIGETKITRAGFCKGDPYRESRLCEGLPQPTE
jgi:hypothetical protein